MDVRPTPVIASLAGTARAQTHASETSDGAAGGGVVRGRESDKTTEIESGAKAEDRDADGRQLLQRGGSEHRDDDPPRGEQSDDLTDAQPPHSSLANESQGTHLDFDA